MKFQCGYPEEFIRWVIQNYDVHSGGSNRLVFQFDYLQRLSKWIIQICGLDKLSWVTKIRYSYALSNCFIRIGNPNALFEKKVFGSFKLYYPNVKNRILQCSLQTI